jgi:methylase of polypeptide subunit release factors
MELEDELRAALETGSTELWRGALEHSSAMDPFRALRNDQARERQITEAAGFPDLQSWFRSAAEWFDNLGRSVDPPAVEVEILRLAWVRLIEQLGRRLGEARRSYPLPAEGGILVFVAGLEICLVVGYRFTGPGYVPALHVVDAWPDPRSVFDVVDDLLRRPHETRNELKRMLQSSHRLVWHRDVLAHVDRREEPHVFGPSIDTLHLAEIIARRYASGSVHHAPSRVLEIGTGSGFISAGILRHIEGVQLLLGVEPDIGSAVCTYRNLDLNAGKNRAALLVSHFSSDLVPGQFDLVVCNPPYIPDPPSGPVDRSRHRTGAVAGIQLIDELLEALPRLVAPGGYALMMASSVTPPQHVIERLPAGFELVHELGADGEEVLFEVEEVFNRPGYLPFLLGRGGLWERGRSYHHRLHALAFIREGQHE